MKEASLYDKIMDQQRLEPEFFRVGFYGKKFPFFLRVRTSPFKQLFLFLPLLAFKDYCVNILILMWVLLLFFFLLLILLRFSHDLQKMESLWPVYVYIHRQYVKCQASCMS